MRHAAPRPSGTDLPLAGRHIVLTRPPDQAGDFSQRIAALGGIPEVAPAIAIVPPHDSAALHAAIARLAHSDWIAFTSANAVRAMAGEIGDAGLPAGVRLACVGDATAAAVAASFRPPDFVPSTANAEALGHEMPVRPGDRILIPHGDLAGGALAAALRQKGAEPEEVDAYRTVPGPGLSRIVSGCQAGRIDALLFASGSAVRFVAEELARHGVLGGQGRMPAIFCIGPATARAAASVGFTTAAVAPAATQDALIDAVAAWFTAHGAAEA